MATVIDYADFSVHITSPQTAVVVQDLLNDIRTFEADVTGITHPVIIEASGKESLGGGVQVGITMKLNDPWQLEFYAGSYRATIDGGNVVTDRADGNVIKLIANSPQIEILRSAAATIVATGSGVTAQDKLDIVGGVWADAQALKLIKTGSNKHVLSPIDGTIKIYDDDSTTLLYSGLAYSDAAGTVLYDGTAPVHHTTRLA